MPYTCSVLCQKGGAGKTVITSNLARRFQLAGLEVLVVDSDPQRSVTDWQATSDEHDMPEVVGVDGPVVHEQVPQLDGYDLVMIDGAGKIDGMSESIIRASDTVLIPVQPASIDMWAVGEMIDLVTKERKRRESLGAAFVLSRAITGTTLVRSSRTALEGLELRLLDSMTYQRVAYVRAMNNGVSVFETDDEKAKGEIEGIADELAEMFEQTKATT